VASFVLKISWREMEFFDDVEEPHGPPRGHGEDDENGVLVIEDIEPDLEDVVSVETIKSSTEEAPEELKNLEHLRSRLSEDHVSWADEPVEDVDLEEENTSRPSSAPKTKSSKSKAKGKNGKKPLTLTTATTTSGSGTIPGPPQAKSKSKGKVMRPAGASNGTSAPTEADAPKMEKKHRDTFGAIVNFVKDLWSMFGGKNVTPLSLYSRLIDHIKFTDEGAIMKATDGFVDFFNAYGKDVFANTLQNIPTGVRIKYGDGKTAYISIQAYIHKSQPEVREAIRQHLMTIAAFIQPEKIVGPSGGPGEASPGGNAAPALGVDTSTNEGRFIDGIMKKANSSMANVDASNPMMATMALFQSGIMGDMITGLQQGVGTGEMDIVKLMGMMQGAMGAMVNAGGQGSPGVSTGSAPGGTAVPALTNSSTLDSRPAPKSKISTKSASPKAPKTQIKKQ
jgi:hypothetical protein